jgi:hypothetical protein
MQSVEVIDQGEDSRAEGDLFALEPVRVAAPVPTLVVRAHV